MSTHKRCTEQLYSAEAEEKMRSIARFTALIATLWFMPPLAQTASATTALYLSEVEHAAASDAVVLATIGAQRTDRDPNSGRLFTHSVVHVDKAVFGDAPAAFEVHQMGGRMGDEVQYIPGDARLQTGERVLLFVRKVDDQWYLTALEQSKYSVVPSLDGTLLERELHGGLFLRSKGGAMTPWVDDTEGSPMTLDRLVWIFADAGLAPVGGEQ